MRSERYDVFGQDTYTPLEEEHFASEMGQPSKVPYEHHGLPTGGSWSGEAEDHTVRNVPVPKYPAVLCQTPVQCQGCGRQTIPFESVLVLVDGDWYHDECR